MKWRGRVLSAAAAGGGSYLSGMRVAVDVQHLYKPAGHDEGSVYQVAGGSVTEAHLSTLYAAALHDFLLSWGAEVMVNDPIRGVLTGDYWQRNRHAHLWGADLYLACHVNAGRGSYARTEMMAAHANDTLCHWIGAELVRAAPEIHTSSITHLAPGERGAVCIQAFDGPGVILEPFFGDNPAEQVLFAASRLVGIGEAIGRGVGNWWRTR